MAETLIELGLLRPDRPAGLIDQLLSILSDAALESDSLKTREFRARLQTYRERLALADGTPEFGRHSIECLSLCEGFYEQSRQYLLERETEFAEVIQYLREAIVALSGDANAFNTQLSQTSDRMERLAELEDLRELKKQITEEVHQLRRTIAEKRERDGDAYTRLTKRVELLQHSLAESRTEASLDGLTGVSNRRTFDRTLSRWIAKGAKANTPFVLALLDLDDFKVINDTRGHPVGDRVLLCAAQFFSKSIRPSDFVARFGGEEFAILLEGATAEQALQKFTETLARLAGTSYNYDVAGAPSSISFTASCGLAECFPGESADSLLKRADEALYVAKRTGKNRAVAARPAKKSGGFWNSIKPLMPFGAEKPV
jgi:diguanylate cyclase